MCWCALCECGCCECHSEYTTQTDNNNRTTHGSPGHFVFTSFVHLLLLLLRCHVCPTLEYNDENIDLLCSIYLHLSPLLASSVSQWMWMWPQLPLSCPVPVFIIVIQRVLLQCIVHWVLCTVVSVFPSHPLLPRYGLLAQTMPIPPSSTSSAPHFPVHCFFDNSYLFPPRFFASFFSSFSSFLCFHSSPSLFALSHLLLLPHTQTIQQRLRIPIPPSYLCTPTPVLFSDSSSSQTLRKTATLCLYPYISLFSFPIHLLFHFVSCVFVRPHHRIFSFSSLSTLLHIDNTFCSGRICYCLPSVPLA